MEREESPDAIAANWVVRLGNGPLDPDGQASLDQWLADSPVNAAAFAGASTAWKRMGDLARAPGSLGRYRADATPFRMIAPGKRRTWIAGGAVAVAALIGVYLGNPLTALRADHRTGTAETETVALEDGTRVDLGPSSAIAVNYDGRSRTVTLLQGAAYFVVTPREQAGGRPFVVSSSGVKATALGTRFQVDSLPGGVDVTVIEHRVEVAPEAQASAAVVLDRGTRVRYAETGGLGPITTTNPDLALAWRDGRLVFDRVPLGDVVAELNRYRVGTIIVGDAALAKRSVSGVFDSNDIDGAIADIASNMGARRVAMPLVTLLY